jgi:hypothetical protein
VHAMKDMAEWICRSTHEWNEFGGQLLAAAEGVQSRRVGGLIDPTATQDALEK